MNTATNGESSSYNTSTLNVLEFQAYNQQQEDHDQHYSMISSWPIPPPVHSFNQQFQGFYIPPPPPPSPPIYGDLYTRSRASSALQFAYDGGGCNIIDPLGLAGLYNYIGSDGRGLQSSSTLSAQEIMDAKALAASKSHSEAERKRRERINAHHAKLRSLLPSATKTDKATLLAEVIQHVKELKRQTSEIAEECSLLPTESDELTVDAASDDNGKFIVKATLCCDDRSDLIPDLIKALKALRLRTLKAEIMTVGGRFKNVLVITGDEDFDESQQQQQQLIVAIQDALKAVMERASVSDEASAVISGIKRQRTNNLATIPEHNSV